MKKFFVDPATGLPSFRGAPGHIGYTLESETVEVRTDGGVQCRAAIRLDWRWVRKNDPDQSRCSVYWFFDFDRFYPDEMLCLARNETIEWRWALGPTELLEQFACVRPSATPAKGPAEDEIRAECDSLANFLCEKNRKYGNSALEPRRIFSKASASEQILVRLDDKLSRLQAAQADDEEDALLDLLGYLVLYRVAKKRGRQ